MKEGGRSNPAARRTERRVFVAATAYEGHGYLILWSSERELKEVMRVALGKANLSEMKTTQSSDHQLWGATTK